MNYSINEQLLRFKFLIEDSIKEGGTIGKTSMIRSSKMINLIHDATKQELICNGVNPDNIRPPLGHSKPELKISGILKQKDQDVCVIPTGIYPTPTPITWGPLAFNKKIDPYGFEFSEKTLIINVRSQMSSLAKNADTLFERTFAEAQNLHLRYPDAVLGEVYLIPVNEYDDALVSKHQVGFKTRQTDLEKYISFFTEINNRSIGEPPHSYERCALLIVDFNQPQPLLFSNSDELKAAGYISSDFDIEYANINFQNFASDILSIYDQRFDINYLI